VSELSKFYIATTIASLAVLAGLAPYWVPAVIRFIRQERKQLLSWWEKKGFAHFQPTHQYARPYFLEAYQANNRIRIKCAIVNAQPCAVQCEFTSTAVDIEEIIGGQTQKIASGYLLQLSTGRERWSANEITYVEVELNPQGKRVIDSALQRGCLLRVSGSVAFSVRISPNEPVERGFQISAVILPELD